MARLDSGGFNRAHVAKRGVGGGEWLGAGNSRLERGTGQPEAQAGEGGRWPTWGREGKGGVGLGLREEISQRAFVNFKIAFLL